MKTTRKFKFGWYHAVFIIAIAIIIGATSGFVMETNKYGISPEQIPCKVVLYTLTNSSSGGHVGFWVPQIACDTLEMQCREASEKKGMYCIFQEIRKECYCEVSRVVNVTSD